MRDSFIQRLETLAEKNPNILLLTADLGFGVLDSFERRFPKQFLNVGVAEQNMIGIATGLALEGRIVFTYSIGNFPSLRCLEQIRNDACYHGANVKIVAVGAGFSYGTLGMSHHATEDLSVLRALPDITLVSPADAWEAAEATEAISRTHGTCYLRLDRSSGAVTSSEGTFQLGKARVVRKGNGFTLVSTGAIVSVTLSAAEKLSHRGIQCRVINVHTLKPFDAEPLIQASRETQGIITIEEHTIDGGLGGAVAESLLEAGAAPRIFYRIGLRNGFSAMVGSQDFLRTHYGIDETTIIAKVSDCLHRLRQTLL